MGWKEGVEKQRAVQATVAEVNEANQLGDVQARARAAWSAGLRCFVHTTRFEWTKVRDLDAAKEVDAVLAVGWELQSSALTYVERTGFNNITCMFTFVRGSAPDPAPVIAKEPGMRGWWQDPSGKWNPPDQR